jgi:hypothetical protein
MTARTCRQCGDELAAGQFCSSECRETFLTELFRVDLDWLRRFAEAPAGPDGRTEPALTIEEALALCRLYTELLDGACEAVERALAELRRRIDELVESAERSGRPTFAYLHAESEALADAYDYFDAIKWPA